jgi:hypothetical protein
MKGVRFAHAEELAGRSRLDVTDGTSRGAVKAMIWGHPYDLWGLAKLFDGQNPDGLLVTAEEPKGEPRIDYSDRNAIERFHRSGYSVQGALIANALDEALARGLPIDQLTGIAADLVTRINGAAKLLDPEYYLVRLVSVMWPTGGHILADHPPNKGYTHLGRHPSHAPGALAFIDLASRDRAAAFVLETFNLPITWASLYLAYDCISADVGGVHALREMGWVSKDSLTDFAFTANKARNIWSGARHGSRPDATPERPLIQLPHGHNTVMRIAIRWLEWKLAREAVAEA